MANKSLREVIEAVEALLPSLVSASNDPEVLEAVAAALERVFEVLDSKAGPLPGAMGELLTLTRLQLGNSDRPYGSTLRTMAAGLISGIRAYRTIADWTARPAVRSAPIPQYLRLGPDELHRGAGSAPAYITFAHGRTAMKLGQDELLGRECQSFEDVVRIVDGLRTDLDAILAEARNRFPPT